MELKEGIKRRQRNEKRKKNKAIKKAGLLAETKKECVDTARKIASEMGPATVHEALAKTRSGYYNSVILALRTEKRGGRFSPKPPIFRGGACSPR